MINNNEDFPQFDMNASFKEVSHFILSPSDWTTQQKLRILEPFFLYNPVIFAKLMFNWQAMGSDGLDTWQEDILYEIETHMKNGDWTRKSLLLTVASGHGIGKSWLSGGVIPAWAMTVFPKLSGRITASTEQQLKGATLKEMKKAHQYLLNKDRFNISAMGIEELGNPTKRFQGITWSENNPHGVAGTHEEGGATMVIFDEASVISDEVYETVQGSMSTLPSFWFTFGNPTRNKGMFFQSHNRYSNIWKARRIDSRTTKLGSQNKQMINDMLERYGEHGNEFKIRIKGEFPSQDEKQFLAANVIYESLERGEKNRNLNNQDRAPLVMGVDVARYGEDLTAIVVRQGRRILYIATYNYTNTNDTVNEVIRAYRLFPNISKIFIDDTGGFGGGVVDFLKASGLTNVRGVHFSSRADDNSKYLNKRAEMWFRMKEWIEDDGELIEKNGVNWLDELTQIEYEYVLQSKAEKLKLQSKKEMKKEGIKSPDVGDALSLTFTDPYVVTPFSDEVALRQNISSYNNNWKERFR